jgi:hypothetical protein
MGAFPTGSLANRKQGGPLGLLPTVSPHNSDSLCLFPRSTTAFIKLRDITKNLLSPQWFFAFFYSFKLYNFRPNSDWPDIPFTICNNSLSSVISLSYFLYVMI